MWCLARLLPLMIGKDISTDDDHWWNYLLLLEILDYVFAPTLTSQSVAHLKLLIDDHHQSFKKLYPTSPITPKMHYIVHYPELILRLLILYYQNTLLIYFASRLLILSLPRTYLMLPPPYPICCLNCLLVGMGLWCVHGV